MKYLQLKKTLAIFLVVLLLMSNCGALFEGYSAAHPAEYKAKSSEEIIEEYEEEYGAYGFEGLVAGKDYAEGELLITLRSTPSNQQASISSVEEAFDVHLDEHLKPTELRGSNTNFLASLGFGESEQLITYHATTDEEDIPALCAKLNALEEVDIAEPNLILSFCDEKDPVDIEQGETAVSQQSTAQELPDAGEAENPAETTPVDPASEPLFARSYTAPAAFSTSTYKNNQQWYFDYYKVSTAWKNYADSSTGYGMGKDVVVAVLDTGCNTAHKDIIDNLWNDGNGHCGYDFYRNTYINLNDSTNDYDDNGAHGEGHGSHCCGMIAMNGDNTIGGIGTAPKCKVMPMKINIDSFGSNMWYGEQAIEKAVEFGADVISMSYGSYTFSVEELRTYQKCATKAVLVASAGNDYFDTNENVHFPSAFSCVTGVMACSGKSTKNKLANFSNCDSFGNLYKVATLGVDNYTIHHTNTSGYTTMGGTSAACPTAAGMIASYMSYIRGIKGWDWTPAQFQYKIESIIQSDNNSLTCTAYSSTTQTFAYNNAKKFKCLDLNLLFAQSQSNDFADVEPVHFNSTAVCDALCNAAGCTPVELDEYALMRIGTLEWSNVDVGKNLTDYSDFPKLTGIQYLNFQDCIGVSDENLPEILMGKSKKMLLYLDLRPVHKISIVAFYVYFKHLYYLNISGNPMPSIGSLRYEGALKYLYASHCNFTSVFYLDTTSNLRVANLSYNQIGDDHFENIFKSPFMTKLDISHNHVTDYSLFKQFNGCYIFKQDPSGYPYYYSYNNDTIDLDIRYNDMTDITQTQANSIKTAIVSRNSTIKTKIQKLYKSIYGSTPSINDVTVNLLYTPQSQAAPDPGTGTVPMTAFTLSDTTISARELCSAGNLNLTSVTGFTKYPANADKGAYLTWECSEEGYFDAYGRVILDVNEITSTRTLTLTGTAPSATSTVTGTASQTIKLTITVPTIRHSALSKTKIKTGDSAYFSVLTDASAQTVVLCTSPVSLTYTPVKTYNLPAEPNCASGCAKYASFPLPESITSAAGSYSLYAFAGDAQGNYLEKGTDIYLSCNGTYSTYYFQQYVGSLTVSASEPTVSPSLSATNSINRYGDAALVTFKNQTDSYAPNNSAETISHLGDLVYDGTAAVGCTGFPAAGYPNAEVGKYLLSLKFTSGNRSYACYVTTVAPTVFDVSLRNADTCIADGYVEYLIQTNSAATKIKAYRYGSNQNIIEDYNLIYSENNTCYWSAIVPNQNGKPAQVSLVAADPLGDSSMRYIPAADIQLSPMAFYPGNTDSQKASDYTQLFPKNAANTLTNAIYRLASSEYFTLTNAATGEVSCDMLKVLRALEDADETGLSTTITATLQTGVSSTAEVRAFRPSLTNVTDHYNGASVNPTDMISFTATTYGSNAVLVYAGETVGTQALYTFTASNATCTAKTDANGNPYTEWSIQIPAEQLLQTPTLCFSSAYTESGETFRSLEAQSLSVALHTGEPGNYEAWQAQCARYENADLARLSNDYGTDIDSYSARVLTVNSCISEANLEYKDLQQDLIDAQTAALKLKIDALFGYSDYADSISSYEQLLSEQNADFIGEYLRDLVTTPIDDSNCKSIGMQIDTELARIHALIDRLAEISAVIRSLEAKIPELKEDYIPYTYGLSSYTALKAQYMALKSSIAAGGYQTIESLNSDFAALTEAKEQLHSHRAYYMHEIAPTDGQSGTIYYTCPACDDTITASYNGSWYAPHETVADLAQATSQCSLPAPAFNRFVSDSCDYSLRGAALRLSESAAYDKDFDTTQGMRFTASIELPEGTEFREGSKNEIVDFGFVYTQSARIAGDINHLIKGGEQVYSLSVKDKNSGVDDPSEWQGATYYPQQNLLTTNLVINIKAQNWEKDYCARAYITYNINGNSFTVYDSGYASRSVAYIAREIVANPLESNQAKRYCEHKILKNI
ncbi:MAG: S8 family serine peptidase [Clostridia bacterium]|nr:S8 family serine peptidase [Clostridia bacterium]